MFLVVSVALAGAAWLLSGDPVRAVAVLVVATPCPLILAAPVAMVSGLARAAKRGVVVKGGAVLERLAGAEVLLFDKTGTLTEGRPTVADIVTDGTIELARCCGWPHRSTRCHPTSSPLRWSGPPTSRAST